MIQNGKIRGKRTLIVMALIILAILGMYIVSVVWSVGEEAERINAAYWNKADAKDLKEKSEMHKVPGYSELLKKQGLLNGMIKMAGSDSIGLFLNIPDSIAQLMIKGVGVRDIPIRKFGLSPFFARLDKEVLYELLSGPFRITGAEATLAKEPINLVRAPKDSSDVIPMVTPDTSNQAPVYFFLDTDKNIRFYVYQTEGGISDNWAGFIFCFKDRWRIAKKTLKSLFVFRRPDYVPMISIGITKADAKVLYRALPVHGQIVLTL